MSYGFSAPCHRPRHRRSWILRCLRARHLLYSYQPSTLSFTSNNPLHLSLSTLIQLLSRYSHLSLCFPDMVLSFINLFLILLFEIKHSYASSFSRSMLSTTAKTPSSGAEEILTAAPTPFCYPLDQGPDQDMFPVHCSCNGARTMFREAGMISLHRLLFLLHGGVMVSP